LRVTEILRLSRILERRGLLPEASLKLIQHVVEVPAQVMKQALGGNLVQALTKLPLRDVFCNALNLQNQTLLSLQTVLPPHQTQQGR